MKKICLKILAPSGEGTVDDMLTMAQQHFTTAEAYLLAESPKRIIFRSWDAGLTTEEAQACHSIIIFSPQAEVRLEKATGSSQGHLRCICHAETGEEVFMREENYLLRHDAGVKGKLRHAEYFKEDCSGMLELYCARLAGIAQGERS